MDILTINQSDDISVTIPLRRMAALYHYKGNTYIYIVFDMNPIKLSDPDKEYLNTILEALENNARENEE